MRKIKYRFKFMIILAMIAVMGIAAGGCSAGEPDQAADAGTGQAGEDNVSAGGDDASGQAAGGADAGGGNNAPDQTGPEGNGAGAGQSGNSEAAGQDTTGTGQAADPDGGALMINADLEGYLKEINGDELICNPTITEDVEGGGQVAYTTVEVDEEQQVYVSCNADTSYELLTMNRASESAVSLETIGKEKLKPDDSLLIYGSASDTTHWTADRVIVIVWE